MTSRWCWSSTGRAPRADPDQVGDGPALTGSDLTDAAADRGHLRRDLSDPHTAPTIRRLAELHPTTLAIMHGSSYNGDAGKALHALADDYEHRLARAS
jgi:hypothetical protein